MRTGTSTDQDQSFATLRRFVRGFGRRRPPGEACELCAAGLLEAHGHLLDVPRGMLVCACGSCVRLFARRADATYRCVPRRVRRLRGFHLTDAQWTALTAAPAGMAFFFRSTRRRRLAAVHLGPTGIAEARLPFETWRDIVAANPTLLDMTPDVEAVLIRRPARMVNSTSASSPCPAICYLVPIDECHRLVSLIRAGVWWEVERFFEDLRNRASGA